MHVDVDLKRIVSGMKLHVLRVNQNFLDMSGYSKETVMNWTVKEALDIVHPNDRLGFKVAMVKAILSNYKKPASYVYRARNCNGTYSYVKIISTGVQQPDKSYLVITNYIVLDL